MSAAPGVQDRSFIVRDGGVSIRIDRHGLIVASALVIAIVALSLWGLTLGSFPVTVPDVIGVLSGGGDGSARKVIVEWRMPRILAAIIFGVLLCISGAVFQSLTRNPLGSPDIIGFNAGSYTGVVVMLMLGISGYAATVTAAMIGGLLVAVVVYFSGVSSGRFGHAADPGRHRDERLPRRSESVVLREGGRR